MSMLEWAKNEIAIASKRERGDKPEDEWDYGCDCYDSALSNTEYLCDAANYLMFEFMYPQREGAFFKSTDSGESAGVAGTPINQLKEKWY